MSCIGNVADRKTCGDARDFDFRNARRRGEGSRRILEFVQKPLAPDFESLVTDWAVANLLQDSTIDDGRYGYAPGGFKVPVTGAAVIPGRSRSDRLLST